TAFKDERLNALEAEALTGNLSLRAAWNRLEQARASAAKQGAALRPSIDMSADASREAREAFDALLGDERRSYTTNVGFGLMAGYELDLWGRLKKTHQAAAQNAQASADDLQAAAVSLTAELANAWYQLVERQGQLRLIDEQIKTNRDYLDLITLQFRQGQASATDVLQQRQLVQSNRANRLQVEPSITILEHRLALLTGKPIGPLPVLSPLALPLLPPLPQTGVPIDWLRRRPDLRAAERRVTAANHALGAAIVDRLPRLSISLRADTNADKTSELFDNWLAALAGNLTAPILDGGRRRAEVRRSQAARDEALNAYGQTVLAAFKEVEDTLVLEQKQDLYIRSLEAQLELSELATEQTRENYMRVGKNFTRYITTLMGHQNLQRTVLSARGRLIEYRIGLYRAIAGSWSLPAPAQDGDRSAKAGAGRLTQER
ncbi:MAG: efflux transporter outer membrane subunit, partial [Lentisphaerae bacterium]|nr:efflux transporter outer membrane subunit [Lentisphaerota bacterium]